MSSSNIRPDTRIRWPNGCTPDSGRVFAQNTIDIAAPAETVWSLLVDCTAWPRWYEHCSDVSIIHGKATLGPGSKFRFKTIGFFFEPEITTCERLHALVWYSKGPLGSSGAHAWYIEQTGNGCRVTTEEVQRGLLLFFISGRMRNTLLRCHQDWLESLRALAEEAHRCAKEAGSAD